MKRHRYYQFTTSIAGHDFAFQAGDVIERRDLDERLAWLAAHRNRGSA